MRVIKQIANSPVVFTLAQCLNGPQLVYWCSYSILNTFTPRRMSVCLSLYLSVRLLVTLRNCIGLRCRPRVAGSLPRSRRLDCRYVCGRQLKSAHAATVSTHAVCIQYQSERCGLAVAAFAARRLDIAHRRGCRAGISKSFVFYLMSDFQKRNIETRLKTILHIVFTFKVDCT